MTKPINVTSEIGKLKSVLLKRPGRELENLTPDTLGRLLFDDIPYLKAVREEHDAFAQALRNEGAETLYLEDLITETLDNNDELRAKFVEQQLRESKLSVFGAEEQLKKYLLAKPTAEMIENIMAGIRKDEVDFKTNLHLHNLATSEDLFYLDPLPSLYFTRDPHSSCGNGVLINKMFEPARQRESMFMEYVIKHHPRFATGEVPIYFDRDYDFAIEGGDTLILNEEVVAIGISARTEPQAIEHFARNMFKMGGKVKKVVAIEIEKIRAFMHLDTVFTMVDYDKFTIHPAIQGPKGDMNIYIIEQSGDDAIKITYRTNLQETLKEVLGLSELLLLPCGRGDVIAAAREQWNDGSNTLAIAPGVVVTYDRNYLSNELMRENGIRVIEVVGSELVRGRGGPRCMSQPLVREDLK